MGERGRGREGGREREGEGGRGRGREGGGRGREGGKEGVEKGGREREGERKTVLSHSNLQHGSKLPTFLFHISNEADLCNPVRIMVCL